MAVICQPESANPASAAAAAISSSLRVGHSQATALALLRNSPADWLLAGWRRPRAAAKTAAIHSGKRTNRSTVCVCDLPASAVRACQRPLLFGLQLDSGGGGGGAAAHEVGWMDVVQPGEWHSLETQQLRQHCLERQVAPAAANWPPPANQ